MVVSITLTIGGNVCVLAVDIFRYLGSRAKEVHSVTSIRPFVQSSTSYSTKAFGAKLSSGHPPLDRYFCFNAAPTSFVPSNTSEKSKKSSWPCPCLPCQTSWRWSGQSWENYFRLCFLLCKEMITCLMNILVFNTQSSSLHFLNSGAGTVQWSCKKVHLRSAHHGSNASQPQPAKQSHLSRAWTKKSSLSSNFAKGNGHCRQNVGKGQEFRLFTRGEYPGWPAVCLTLGKGDCSWRCVGSNLTNNS